MRRGNGYYEVKYGRSVIEAYLNSYRYKGSEVKRNANCKTTAMGIMPHTDASKAMSLALGLDIPFLPQLPKVSFYEDMYVQTSHGFPGVSVDILQERVIFDTAKFEEELDSYFQRLENPDAFLMAADHSVSIRTFLAQRLDGYPAIRGQLTGPVSLGFRIVDENSKPIIYNEEVRAILFDFIQRKVNAQYEQLREKNDNAFVWLDEPGLGWVFSGFTGYNDIQAKEDYQNFLKGVKSLKALHLCANVNLPYLLELGIELLSFDAYQLKVMPKGYTSMLGDFMRRGGIISWGIVPTDSDSVSKETPESLARLLSGYWERISEGGGIKLKQIAEQALVAPARCCLKNVGQVGSVDDSPKPKGATRPSATVEERLVELAFSYLKDISQMLKEKYQLY